MQFNMLNWIPGTKINDTSGRIGNIYYMTLTEHLLTLSHFIYILVMHTKFSMGE